MTDAIGTQERNPTTLMSAVGRAGNGMSTRSVTGSRLAASFLLLGGALVALAGPSSLSAAGSRAAVEAKPGEIVVLRAVPARHAARPMPPGRALLVDASPKSELEQGLSHLEISSAGYGQVAAGGAGPVATSGLGATVGSITQQLGGVGHARHSAPSMAGGAMGAATGSIGSTVTGALSSAGLMGQGGRR
ncbi:MAG: hypothetical protein ACLFVH_14200 [Phycisphaerae bacterium]